MSLAKDVDEMLHPSENYAMKARYRYQGHNPVWDKNSIGFSSVQSAQQGLRPRIPVLAQIANPRYIRHLGRHLLRRRGLRLVVNLHKIHSLVIVVSVR